MNDYIVEIILIAIALIIFAGMIGFKIGAGL